MVPQSNTMESLIREFGTDPSDIPAVVRLARSLHRQHVRWFKTEGGLSDWNKRMRNDARDMISFARANRAA